MSKEKRRFGDRRDGKLIRQQDGMHLIMPMIYPNRIPAAAITRPSYPSA